MKHEIVVSPNKHRVRIKFKTAQNSPLQSPVRFNPESIQSPKQNRVQVRLDTIMRSS